MKKAISTIRIATLVAMGGIGILMLLGAEQDETILEYILHFMFDKVIGIVLIAWAVALAVKWCKADEWLSAYVKWCNEE